MHALISFKHSLCSESNLSCPIYNATIVQSRLVGSFLSSGYSLIISKFNLQEQHKPTIVCEGTFLHHMATALSLRLVTALLDCYVSFIRSIALISPGRYASAADNSDKQILWPGHVAARQSIAMPLCGLVLATSKAPAQQHSQLP